MVVTSLVQGIHLTISEHRMHVLNGLPGADMIRDSLTSACLHGGDVMAVHKQLCLDHAGRGASVYEALVQHMVGRLDRAVRPACPLCHAKCATARHTAERPEI